MTTITTNSPSGLRVTVRGLTLAEVDMLGSAQKRRRIDVMDQILSKCWQETVDPGPCYDFTDRPDWDAVLQGDREDILFAIRKATYGPEYSFKIQCDNPACRHSFEETVNLEGLRVQGLSDESSRRFRDGNRFEVELEGFRYVYALATGAHLKRFEKKKQQRLQHVQLLTLESRVMEIHHQDGRLGRSDAVAHLSGLPMNTVEDLRDEFDRHDCGIDTMILDIECPSCFSSQDADLPFDVDFFSPRARKRADRRRRRISATFSEENTQQEKSVHGSGSSAISRSSEAVSG